MRPGPARPGDPGRSQPAPLRASSEPVLAARAEPEVAERPGEQITFHISYPGHGGEQVAWKLTTDGFGNVGDGRATLDAGGAAQITGALSHPGFLRCEATCGKSVALAGAAVGPLSITPSLPPPDDFDTFWESKKALLRATPVAATLTPVPAHMQQPGVASFSVKADSCVGAGVSAYLARPADATGNLPAVRVVHGAGVYTSSLESAQDWAAGNNPEGIGAAVGDRGSDHRAFRYPKTDRFLLKTVNV